MSEFNLAVRPSQNETCTVIAAAHADALARHGDLDLPPDIFADCLDSVVRKHLASSYSAGEAAALISRLHTGDLYLALACSRGNEAAWCRFARMYRKYIDDLMRYQTRTEGASRELADNVIVDLFLPDGSGRSRIGSYDGRSSLTTWLHAVVCHRAANERSRREHAVERRGDLPDVADAAAMALLEAGVKQGHYWQPVEASFRVACTELTPQERLILLWRYDECLLLSEIATLLRVHPSTVNRQLERLCRKLRARVTALLVSKHRMTSLTAEECLTEVVESRSDAISVLAILRDAGPTGSPASPLVVGAGTSERHPRASGNGNHGPNRAANSPTLPRLRRMSR